MSPPELDAFDASILNLLQKDNRLTAQLVAQEVGLSAAACQKRMKRLRSSGIIEAEVAQLSPKAVGMNLTAIVLVRVSRDTARELDDFRRKMLKAPEVTQCYYVTGECNFVLLVTMPDMAAYEAFSRKYFIENAGVSHFVTSVIMDRVKTHGIIPVEAF